MDSTLDKFELVHYSLEPIDKLLEICYLQKPDLKPNGLWFSVEGPEAIIDWRQWCVAENFHMGNLKYRYKIRLKESAEILHLKSPREIKNLTTCFGVKPYNSLNFLYIDWKKISQDYDGIVIAPYQWNCRFDPFWYYGWDCSSGCIWNSEVIESLTLVEPIQLSYHQST